VRQVLASGSLRAILTGGDQSFPATLPGIESVYADANDDSSVAAAVAGTFAIVNAVSLFVERGKQTFHSVHVEAAERVARLAFQSEAETLALISGIGADAHSGSPSPRPHGSD
jgi:hypothetical protein